MNLLIDIGNTRIKYAMFEKSVIQHGILDELSVKEINNLQKKLKGVKSCIISSVRKIDSDMIHNIKAMFEHFIYLDENTPIPITNCYTGASTLGRDRLAGVVGAYNICRNKNVLVVDFGTAITFDLLNSKGEYLGGTISPGVSLRFKALNHFTDQLPLLEMDQDTSLIGDTTETSIKSGVSNGVLFEVEGYIKRLSEKFEDLQVIFTGGDFGFFDKKLKNTIFAEPNLIFIGLNSILEHNA